MNAAARRYTSEFKSNTDVLAPEENFIIRYIQKEDAYHHFGPAKIIYSKKEQPYFINAVPSQASDGNSLKMYIYIIPQKAADNQVKNFIPGLRTNLTDRQLQIINCVLEGKSNRVIAEELFISINTVKTHLNNIYRELNITNRLGLYSILIKLK